MKKYLEIIEFGTNEVVKRTDVSSLTERGVQRMENGMNINLNHDKYFTKLTESENILIKI